MWLRPVRSDVMALLQAGGAFANPLGLLGLAALVPLVLLYLVRPDPRRYALPTVEFLTEADGDSRRQRLRDRIHVPTVLLLQATVLIAIPLALAGPQVPLPGDAGGETVVVLDNSASMATTDGDATRFERAVGVADEASGDQPTLVTSAPGPAIRAADRDATAVSVAETDGDLRRAIRVAADAADDPRRIVVVSDFVDATDWEAAIESVRAGGTEVVVRRVGGGGEDNVGIVDLSVTATEATAVVTNGGETEQTRTVSLGETTETVTLAPGDVTRVTLSVPPGGGELRLSPRDSFPTDDVAYVAVPSDRTIDALLVTNDRHPFITAALDVMDDVRLDVAEPPITDATGYDVVVFSNVDPDRVLEGTVDGVRSEVENGAGVVIQAQSDLDAVGYGEMALVTADGVGNQTDVRAVGSHPVVADIGFVPAETYLSGELRRGEALAVADDDSPMIAVDDVGDGRAVYYGYMGTESAFGYDYQYPLFWRQTLTYAAGRTPVDELNRRTGAAIAFDEPRTVETPGGTVETARLRPTQTGMYATRTARYGVSLLSPTESAVVSEPVAVETRATSREAGSTPRSIAPALSLAALLLGLVELGYLKRRGEL